MRQFLVWAFFLSFMVTSAWPETIQCVETNISVNSRQSTYAEMTCEAVKQTEALFEQCDMPPFTEPLRIEIVSELKPGCVAIYHCDEDWIEVLEPPLMEARRSSENAFAFLTIESYFQSVVVHELSHSVFDDVPCPFVACVTADEYVAYTMQVMSLTAGQQAEFEANSELDRKISRDELSTIILLMAPSLFAQKSWAHLSQRDDPCTFIGQIMDGTVLLDYDRF